ncbi:MAG: hypothetical protein KatS3mg111_0154 [Pirellulaceae bacterium]|nr:MAG: hypothetical protein KatS3mg111_0154 [Pirellulaceae bacterium]
MARPPQQATFASGRQRQTASGLADDEACQAVGAVTVTRREALPSDYSC